MNCPKCQSPVAADANFCEVCGAPLKTPTPAAEAAAHLDDCEGCGAGPDLIQEDGYCARCGLLRRHPERDHFEIEIPPRLGGVSDRGVKHFRNEDFIVGKDAAGVLIGVVCDGVSNSQGPDAASAAAAPVAGEALLARLAEPAADAEAAMKGAILQANAAVLATASGDAEQKDPPSSTIIAAAVIPAGHSVEAVLGWLGDSRAYFIGANSEKQLTTDHSWLEEIVQSGKMTYAAAAKCRGSHAITRTLGGIPAEEGGEPDQPSVIRYPLLEPGWLILCTDGLWNYAPELPVFATLVRRLSTTGSPLELARELVAWAKKQGGKDNVSVIAIAV